MQLVGCHAALLPNIPELHVRVFRARDNVCSCLVCTDLGNVSAVSFQRARDFVRLVVIAHYGAAEGACHDEVLFLSEANAGYVRGEAAEYLLRLLLVKVKYRERAVVITRRQQELSGCNSSTEEVRVLTSTVFHNRVQLLLYHYVIFKFTSDSYRNH